MSRLDNLKKQHPGLNVSLIDIISTVDPTKTYKYTEFLIRMLNKVIEPSDIVRVMAEGMFGETTIEMMKKFESHCQANRIKNPDISTYKDFSEIENAVIEADEIIRQKELERQVVKIYDTNDWLAIIPLTYESSKVYGSNTKWCTTQETHWKSYQPNYKLIYIIDKVGNRKFAISRKYDDNSKVQAWLSDDKETSPMLLPIPSDLMMIVINELKKNKDEIDFSRLGEDVIYLQNGIVLSIEQATISQLRGFLRHYDKKIPAKLRESVEKQIAVLTEEEKKPTAIPEDTWSKLLNEYFDSPDYYIASSDPFSKKSNTVLSYLSKLKK
jgi:hypothetical protein